MFSEGTHRALTGRWSISRAPYLVVAPTTIGSVVLIECKTYEVREILGWFTASALGYLVFCGILYLAHVTIFKNRSTIPTPVWWIFCLGFLAGVFKGVSTAWISFGFGLEENLTQAIASRIFSAGLLGLIGVPSLAIIMNLLQEFRQKRSELIAERILMESREMQSQEMVTAMSVQLRATIEKDLDHLLTEIRQSLKEDRPGENTGWQILADNLRKTARDSIRGISHRLWEKQHTEVPNLTLVDIGKAMITTSAYPLRLILPILVISVIPQTVNDHGLTNLWIRVAALCLCTSLVYLTANFLIKKFHSHKTSIYVEGLAVAALLPTIYGALFFKDTIGAHFFGIAIIFAIWLPNLTITCGLIDTALKQRREILENLAAGIDKSRIRTISAENESLRLSNEMAKYLHGNLQSRLMASALAIELAGQAQNFSLLEVEIDKARKSIQTPFDQFAVQNLNSASVEVAGLLKAWDGVLATKLTFIGSDDLVSVLETRNLIHVIEESFSNALRHGMADEVSVKITVAPNLITLSVIDNGLGPRDGSPSLGTSLFNSIAGSNWSLTRGPDGVGAHLNLQIVK